MKYIRRILWILLLLLVVNIFFGTNTKASEATTKTDSVSLADIPEYKSKPYVKINKNVPFFTDNDMTTASFESYSELDRLGRCGAAFACVGADLMPTEERGAIGTIKPSGWHLVKYDGIEDNYLYNRCHLIAYQLTAENANEKNLITGTRYLNIDGMLPFENKVASYIERTDNHVLYRVTPLFDGDNLLASGVLMEAKSVEDDGEGLQFCVYCYNVQPGITIDYATGKSKGPKYTGETASNSSSTLTYVVNTNTKKFHDPSCSSVDDIKEKNRLDSSESRDTLIKQGYVPCKRCNP